MKENAPKILLLDIETSPVTGYVWGVYEQNVLKVIEPSKIIMAAWQWLDEAKPYVKGIADYKGYKKGLINDRALVEDLWKLLDDADIVIAHNASAFDIKKLNARFIAHHLNLPSTYKVIDTLKVAKKYFKFDSNKLDWLGDYLGEGRKESTGGFDLWDKCIQGDPAAWAKMARYNTQDVRLLLKIYLRLRPYMDNHPNLNIIAKAKATPIDLFACPACRSTHTQQRGFSITKTGSYKRYQCQDCGSWSSSKFTRTEGMELR